jgi:hypothetical protein
MSGNPESAQPQQPHPDPAASPETEQRGYQPQPSAHVDLTTLKPPHGDTAIVRPEKPTPKQ